MDSAFWRFSVVVGLFLSSVAAVQGLPQNPADLSQNAQGKKLPTGVILVKGAWSSASDSVTPVPEGGQVANGMYRNDYFGLTYRLPREWTEKYSGPPPSDTGYYVLAQISPADTFRGMSQGSILIAAQDLFFAQTPASSTRELIDYTKDHLSADYKVEQLPTEVRIANHSFVRFDYVSPVADLHWHVLVTQIRCHMIQFVFTSRDTDLMEGLIQQMSAMDLPVEAGLTSGNGGYGAPVCIRNYASDENVIERDDPVFAERTLNPIPVRIIIDKEGRIKHIHFLSAFPAQAKSITDALAQWRFKPYLRDGQPVEVETGVMFGNPPHPAARPAPPR